ncbi:RHS repeat-associated core domain-containing protein [Paludibaculum fermentans]|uniref:RHS repeat-associated core domain-containing protein n=1 Tax=Paludibaculum fermentans TaxID=1473598 RepID=UPI003EB7EE4E
MPSGAATGRTGSSWTSASEPRSKFSGKERDVEMGLDYFGAKYFSGAQGRFTTPEWSAKPEPVLYADLNDPQLLTLYAYVRNNPLKNRDLENHICIFGIRNTCTTVATPKPWTSNMGQSRRLRLRICTWTPATMLAVLRSS